MAEAGKGRKNAPENCECPVCGEMFHQPKLLPCAHTVCKKCVLSWLKTEGHRGTCPFCRTPILPASHPPHGDVTSFVDGLPTDLATTATVENQKIIDGPRVCDICEDDEKSCEGGEKACKDGVKNCEGSASKPSAAKSFCLDCRVRLCTSCVKSHRKLPVTRNHALEDLEQLTPQRLAATQRAPCDLDPDLSAEFYCSHHNALLCSTCFSSGHSHCAGVMGLRVASAEERKSLTEHAQRLRAKDTTLGAKVRQGHVLVRDTQEHFKDMRNKVKVTFDRLHELLADRHQELVNDLQQQEHAFVTPRLEDIDRLEHERTCLKANAQAVERLMSNAGDAALFGMLSKLKQRLSDLEKHTGQSAIEPTPIAVVSFDPNALDDLQQAVQKFGQITESSDPFEGKDRGEHDDKDGDLQAAPSCEERISSQEGAACEEFGITAASALDGARSPASLKRSSSSPAVPEALGVSVSQDDTNSLDDIVLGLATGQVSLSLAEDVSKLAAIAVENTFPEEKTDMNTKHDDVEQPTATSAFGEVPRTTSVSGSSSSESSRSAVGSLPDTSTLNELPFPAGFPDHDRPMSSSRSRSISESGCYHGYQPVVRKHMAEDVFSSDFVAEWTPRERKQCTTGADQPDARRTSPQVGRRTRLSDPGMQRVRRGRDWSDIFLESLDGSPPGLGTIIQYGEGPRARGSGWVNVRWDATGRSRWYRMGAEGCYDVELV